MKGGLECPLNTSVSGAAPFRYRSNWKLNVKVLDFVKSGGPKLTVDRTIFEIRLAL